MFTRKKITIPAAGSSALVGVNGNSLIIESAPVYSSPEQVPIFFFNDPANLPQPIYPQSIYRSENKFNRLFVEGTDESAGDVIFILTTPDCLNSEINLNISGQKRATLKASFAVTMTDTAQSLSLLQIQDADGNLPSAMYITPTGSAARYAFDEAPVQTVDGGVAHAIAQDEVQKIEGINFITAFQFLSATAGGAGVMTFTMEY